MKVENFETAKKLEAAMAAAKQEVFGKLIPDFWLNNLLEIRNNAKENSTEHRLAGKYIKMLEDFNVATEMYAQIEQDYLDAMEELG